MQMLRLLLCRYDYYLWSYHVKNCISLVWLLLPTTLLSYHTFLNVLITYAFVIYNLKCQLTEHICEVCNQEVNKYKLGCYIEKIHPEIDVLERGKIVLRRKQEGKKHNVEQLSQCPFRSESGIRCQTFLLNVG